LIWLKLNQFTKCAFLNFIFSHALSLFIVYIFYSSFFFTINLQKVFYSILNSMRTSLMFNIYIYILYVYMQIRMFIFIYVYKLIYTFNIYLNLNLWICTYYHLDIYFYVCPYVCECVCFFWAHYEKDYFSKRHANFERIKENKLKFIHYICINH
jgi:hypothetical protein